jgi:hypothetical protein
LPSRERGRGHFFAPLYQDAQTPMNRCPCFQSQSINRQYAFDFDKRYRVDRDTQNNVYIVDSLNRRIRKIAPAAPLQP